MSFSPPSTIALDSSSDWGSNGDYYVHSSNGTYQLNTNGTLQGNKNIQFTNTNGTLNLNVNPSSSGSGAPSSFKINDVQAGGSGVVQQGQTIKLYNGSTLKASFTMPNFYSGSGSGGGPGTLSSDDTASFAGTTLQQIQWSITNGSSSTANTNYYLFNETPGGSALDQINVGSNPQSGAISYSTYVNSSGADFTGKWYIGYGQNTTRVNLKVYDFDANRKVFCNFW